MRKLPKLVSKMSTATTQGCFKKETSTRCSTNITGKASILFGAASLESSPRSVLAWKEDVGYESEGWEPSIFGPRSSSDPSPLARHSRSLSTPSRGRSPGPYHEWRSFPPTSTRALSSCGDEDSCGSQFSDTRWEVASSWRGSRHTARSECTSSHEDEDMDGESCSSSLTSASSYRQDNQAHSMNALNEELIALKSCAKRAINLGVKVQQLAVEEVQQLQTEKASAEGTARKLFDANHELAQKLFAIQEEKQKLDEKLQTMYSEKQQLERERDSLQLALQEEKRTREKVQREKDCLLSAILEESMKMETEREAARSTLRGERNKLEAAERTLRQETSKREALESALSEERNKLEAMETERDEAVKSLQDGKRKLDIERDAMLMSLRDLKTRLEFEGDAQLRSMRRSSLDVCVAKMNSGERKKSMSLSRLMGEKSLSFQAPSERDVKLSRMREKSLSMQIPSERDFTFRSPLVLRSS